MAELNDLRETTMMIRGENWQNHPRQLSMLSLPWRSRISAEQMKAFILARLPANAMGSDVERIFTRIGLEPHRSRGLGFVQVKVAGGSRFLIVPTWWLVTAAVDRETDKVTDLEILHLSQL